jgi:hypothetical protein
MASIALFFPKTRNIGLFYCILWGFLTAIARPYAYVQWDLGIIKCLYWLSEAMYRVPHFGIPYFIFLEQKLEK